MSATLDRAHARQLRRLFLGVVTGSFVFLLAWIGYLAVSLPSDRQVHQWRIAWLGFDIALVAAVGITALCAWGRRQIFIPWATITATLLCCDAWFDIVLDWNTPDLPLSLLSAGLGEVPLAGLLFLHGSSADPAVPSGGLEPSGPPRTTAAVLPDSALRQPAAGAGGIMGGQNVAECRGVVLDDRQAAVRGARLPLSGRAGALLCHGPRR